MRKRIGWLFVGLALFMAAPAAASAASPWTNEVDYNSKAIGKLKYGLVNTFLGWTELFQEPYEAAQYGENFFVGLGRGLVYGVADTVGGVLHVVTFPVTNLDVPLPEGGTDVIEY